MTPPEDLSHIIKSINNYHLNLHSNLVSGVLGFWDYNVAPEDMKYDLEVSDQEDHLNQSSVIMQYGSARKNHYGGIKYVKLPNDNNFRHVGTIIDEFGLNNGFNNILRFMAQIKNGDLKVSVEHLGLVMVFLARTMPFWTREFMCTQIEMFN